jgi:hypothetical protein
MKTEPRFQLGESTAPAHDRANRALKAYVESFDRAWLAMDACNVCYLYMFRAIRASLKDPHAIRNATKTLVAKRDAFKQALAIFAACHIAWDEALKKSSVSRN